MRMHLFTSTLVLILVGGAMVIALFDLYGKSDQAFAQDKEAKTETIKLPEPKHDGEVSVEKALSERRSVRAYKDEPLTLTDVSQILWAAQGITDPKTGHRTAPSAMALYLLNVYLIAGNVTDLPMGMYKYQPQGHELVKVAPGDMKAKLFEAAGQAPIKAAPAALVITGQSERAKSPSWMYLEAGHAAQNVYLQAVSLKIGTVVMGGFKDESVKTALNLPKGEQTIYIMPLGKK
ncbi:MAG: SagB/ThcOx family dehydrogenase [Candidatus Zixiibacteriota bacterium]